MSSVDGGLEQRVRSRIEALEAGGLLRTLRSPHGVDLCSNDYLNLASHPELIARLIDAVAREGCGSTGSRLLRGQRECFAAVEQRFASFKSSERALFFSSGYLANLAVLTTLPELGDVVFSDERNHASIVDGVRLSRARRVIFPHNDVGRLAALLNAEREAAVRFVVVESLFSMDGDVAPLAAYAALCRSTGSILIVDEAHAVGIYGARGSGLMEAAGVSEAVCVSINAAGKALGVAGAFVAGRGWAVEYLLQRARPFVFSTAAPPALAGALDASLDIISTEPERRNELLDRSSHLRRRLAAAGLSVTPGQSQIIPILLGDNTRAVAVDRLLQDAGFDVRAIRPPTVPAGTARLRVSLNAALPESTLDDFVRALLAALASVDGGGGQTPAVDSPSSPSIGA